MKSSLIALCWMILILPSVDAQANSRTQRKLTQPCSLGVRALDMLDNSMSYDCFCDLKKADKNANALLTRVYIHQSMCRQQLLDKASSNSFDLFVENTKIDVNNHLMIAKNASMKFIKRGDDDSEHNNREGTAFLQAGAATDLDSRIGTKDNGELQTHQDIINRGQSNVFLRADDNSRKLEERKLLNIQYNMLVVNVGGADYALPTTEDKLRDDWFLDSASLATQIRDCSANQMTFNQYPGVNDGVTTVIFDHNIAGIRARTLEEMVLDKLRSRGMVFGAEHKYDKVALCFPVATFLGDSEPVYRGAAAYGFANGYSSVYRGDFCHRISTQMHEVGHNLGLAHSGDLIDVTNPLRGPGMEAIFGDATGAMGGYQSADDYEICYNAPKTWQLGWRPSIDILSTAPPKTHDLTLTSFADWDMYDEKEVCIARVVTPETVFYVHYNRQVGSNADVREYGDQVVVATTKNSNDFSNLQSSIVAVMDVGGSYLLENVGGSGMNLLIKTTAVQGATASISVTLTDENSSIIDKPIDPTSRPSSSPSIAPSQASNVMNLAIRGPGDVNTSFSEQTIFFAVNSPAQQSSQRGQIGRGSRMIPKASYRSRRFRRQPT